MVDLNLRRSGILLPLFSLPGSTGIGTMGEFAYNFIDILKKSGQTYWQLLPLGVTDKGNSPYQCFSSNAGNPLFIDFDILWKRGFLNKRDFSAFVRDGDESRINYRRIYKERAAVFNRLYESFKKNIPEDFYSFLNEEDSWLNDYAMFMTIRELSGDDFLFSRESSALRKRDEKALTEIEKNHSDRIFYHKMLQYFFFLQWYELKKYANENGIYIIGDLPYYVSTNSVEVWKNPECFRVDEELSVKYVAGCPPDDFSTDGQLWGNVVYNNDYITKDGYRLWLDRFDFARKMYDVIRIDHFKAFESYYVIDSKEKNAKNGKWLKGVGYDFFKCMKRQLGEIPVIAEDLGYRTKELEALISECGFPGMKVLQFAFDGKADNEYLPHNYTKNSVVYTGTHDNDTTLGFFLSADRNQLKAAKEYLRTRKTTLLLRECIMSALSSVSDLCIIPLQDLLGLDSEARVNIPSTSENNWQWRVTHEQLKNLDCESLLKYTKLYGRAD